MTGIKFLFRRVLTDLSFGVAYMLLYVLLFSQMEMGNSVLYTVNTLILLFPIMSFVNIGGTYMNLSLSHGSTRKEYFLATLILKVIVSVICYGFTVALGYIVEQTLVVSVSSFLWFICVAYLLCTVGQIFGILMARMGKAIVWIYAGLMGVVGAVIGVYGVMRGASGGTAVIAQGIITFISSNGILIGLLLAGMVGASVLLYQMGRKAVVK